LRQAARTADSIIHSSFPAANVDVSAVEIGQTVLEEEYRRIQVPILVAEQVEFTIPGGFVVEGELWSAYSTVIFANELRQLWQEHGTKLMSPNIRDYLGIVKTQRNINFGIKETARTQPGNFAIYNNGITVLVHDFQQFKKEGGDLALRVTGVGIVNGGQTTGVIGSLDQQ
jgi:hypothetical protein